MSHRALSLNLLFHFEVCIGKTCKLRQMCNHQHLMIVRQRPQLLPYHCADTSADAAQISGVCAVFAESEVINHVSSGIPPADIMHGAIVSLVTRSVQLMKRVRPEPEVTLVGGIMRFPTMVRVMEQQLGQRVNVPPEALVQLSGAVGAAVLAHQRLAKLSLAA